MEHELALCARVIKAIRQNTEDLLSSSSENFKLLTGMLREAFYCKWSSLYS
jgi:hypothetical protein